MRWLQPTVFAALVAAPGLVHAEPPEGPFDLGTRDDAADTPRFELRRSADGSYVYRDPGGAFTARIRPDGSVAIRRSPLIRPPQLTILGFDVSGAWRGRTPGKVKRAEQAKRDDTLRRNDAFHVQSAYGAVMPLIGIGMALPGLSDAATRKRSHARAMTKFLTRTAAMRRRMAVSWQRERMRLEYAELGQRLVTLWNDETIPLALRKQRVFELWDDLLDAPTGELDSPPPHAPPEQDEQKEDEFGPDDKEAASPRLSDKQARALLRERHEYAGQARRKIEAFIRLKAPAGSDQAYSPAELERFNARRVSAERFDPYGRTD